MNTARRPHRRHEAAPRVAGVAGQSEAAIWGPRFALIASVGWMSSFLIGFERAVLFLSLVGLAAGIAGLRRPVVGLFGVGILCTMDVLSRSFAGGLWRWNTFNYLLLLVVVVNFSYLLRVSGGEVRRLQLLAAFLVVGLAISESPGAGAQHILDLLSVFGLLVYFRRAGHPAEMAYWLAVVTGILGAAGGFLFSLWKDDLPWVNPNAWALFPLTPLFAVCLAYYEGTLKPRRRGFLLALAAINTVWIFLSASRGALAMAIVCAVFLLVQMLKRGGEALIGMAVAATVMVFIGSMFVDQESRAVGRISRLFDSSESMTDRSSGRSDLALGAWYIFLDHPFGVGTGGFAANWARLGKREGLSGFDEGNEVSAHSGWAKTLAENGLIGFGLLVTFVVSFPRSGWHRAGARGLALGGLVTAVLSLGFLVTEFQSKGLWFLTAGVMSLTLRARRLASAPLGRRPSGAIRAPDVTVGGSFAASEGGDRNLI